MIKKWNDFIFEDQNNQNVNISNEIKEELKKMIEETVKEKGGEYESFIKKLLDDSEDVKIEGLINDSDIFNFYLKWRNDLDPILNSSNFFDKSPKEIDKMGLYEYVVEGTNTAVLAVVKSLQPKK
jgi:hypothetical protein